MRLGNPCGICGFCDEMATGFCDRCGIACCDHHMNECYDPPGDWRCPRCCEECDRPAPEEETHGLPRPSDR